MVESNAGSYGSLAQDARGKQLKQAKVLLWIIGLLTLAVYGFLFLNVESQFEKEVNKELGKQGSSLAEVRRDIDPSKKDEFEALYADGLKKTRLLYAVSAVLGLIFIGCALMVNKKPVAATVTGLVLYVGAFFAALAIDPESAPKGLIIKVLIVVGLVSAVKAALAYEREQKQPQPV